MDLYARVPRRYGRYTSDEPRLPQRIPYRCQTATLSGGPWKCRLAGYGENGYLREKFPRYVIPVSFHTYLRTAVRESDDNSLITIFQAFLFFVSEIQRARLGLPMTTLEVTAMSFSLVMFATSVTWCFKPSISRPRFIATKGDKSVESIRAYARQHVS
jgi:hypothetical protein